MKDSKLVYNERVKLTANWLSAIGLGQIGFGFLRYITDNNQSFSVNSLWWVVAGFVFFLIALYVLTYLKD